VRFWGLTVARGQRSHPRLGRTVVTRAEVPQRAFYETSQSVEDCLSAAFEEGLARLTAAVQEAAGCEQRWLERVRAGLVALLGFLDDEPKLGRLLILEAFAAGAAALERRRREHEVLDGLLRERRAEAVAGRKPMPSPALVSELVLGGVFSVIHARMLEGDGGALVELAPSLMSFIVVPYLGQAAASAEFTGRSAAAEQPSRRVSEPSSIPLPVPVSHRTTLVLRAIACAPRSSNREVAEAAGLGDEGQTSHLLRRLAQRGLIEKVAPRSGSRRENAWLLTPCGRRVIELLDLSAAVTPCAPARRSASVGRAA
jgi:DNA-binding MarR family transcriptional regulator